MPVPKGFHRHKYGGGLVANTAFVAETAFIGPNARVYENTSVCGDYIVKDDTILITGIYGTLEEKPEQIQVVNDILQDILDEVLGKIENA